MATATQNTPLIDVPFTLENFTYARVKTPTDKKDPEGNIIYEYEVVNEDRAKEIEKEHSEGKTKDEVEFYQTAAIPRANTFEGLKEVCPSEKEACKLFSNGAKTKLQNKFRALLLAKSEDGDLSFEPKEGVLDLSEYLPVESTSRGTSVQDKAKKMLAQLPPEQFSQMMEFMKAIQAAQAQGQV